MNEEMNNADTLQADEIDEEVLEHLTRKAFPAIAMRGAVGFVYSEFNLEIGRDASIAALEQALKEDNRDAKGYGGGKTD